MKTFFSFALSFLFLTSFSAYADMTCIDVSRALLPRCPAGEKLFINKGSCTQRNHVEYVYCANEEFTNLETVLGETQVLGSHGESEFELAVLHGSGHMLHVKRGMIKNCANARVVVGQSKEALESLDPSQGEIGIGHSVISFHCIE